MVPMSGPRWQQYSAYCKILVYSRPLYEFAASASKLKVLYVAILFGQQRPINCRMEKFEDFQCALCAPREIQLKLNDHSQLFSFSNYMLTQIYCNM